MATSQRSASTSRQQQPATALRDESNSFGGQHVTIVACLCAAVILIILLATQWLDVSGSAAVDPSGLVDLVESFDFEAVRMLRF